MLILSVVILIILGSLYQFNSAFKVFVSNYFGNYTACLLETGELPGLFSSGVSSGGRCDAEFKTYNASDGTPLVTGGGNGGAGGGGGTGGGNGGGTGSSRSNASDRNKGRNGASTSRSDGTGSSGGGGNGGGGFGSINKFGNKKGQSAKTKLGNVADDKTYTGSTDASSKKGRVVGTLAANNAGSGGKRLQLDRRFVAEGEIPKEVEAPIKAQVDSDQEQRGKAKKLKYELRKPAEVKTDSDGYSFSIEGMLRFLLIAALLVVLFVLLSGQFASISKSMDKE